MATRPKTFMAFRADPEIARGMQLLHARDGISISEQLRRGMTEWLKAKKVYRLKKEKKR